jgi:uncharacterized protein with PCYCGC motif
LASNKTNTWLWIAAVVVLVGGGWAMFRGTSEPAPAAETPQQTAAITPPTSAPELLPVDNAAGQTLPPEIFLDPKAREAYQVAKEIPEVLKELPCFCGCMRTHGHKNNLFCFMDEHGSACEICEDIALIAKQMHSNGASIKEIQDNVKGKYASLLPQQ